jgi:hypothetical protein
VIQLGIPGFRGLPMHKVFFVYPKSRRQRPWSRPRLGKHPLRLTLRANLRLKASSRHIWYSTTLDHITRAAADANGPLKRSKFDISVPKQTICLDLTWERSPPRLTLFRISIVGAWCLYCWNEYGSGSASHIQYPNGHFAFCKRETCWW